MNAGLTLSRADTQTGVLEWYRQPVEDLALWAEVLERSEQAKKRQNR